jgi:hypothetical protein
MVFFDMAHFKSAVGIAEKIWQRPIRFLATKSLSGLEIAAVLAPLR